MHCWIWKWGFYCSSHLSFLCSCFHPPSHLLCSTLTAKSYTWFLRSKVYWDHWYDFQKNVVNIFLRVLLTCKIKCWKDFCKKSREKQTRGRGLICPKRASPGSPMVKDDMKQRASRSQRGQRSFHLIILFSMTHSWNVWGDPVRCDGHFGLIAQWQRQ